MTLFSRIWSFIRKPTAYVGKDFEGNYFYEYRSTNNDPRRTRRIVKYKGKMDTLEIAERSRELPVQWKSWLTHTRRDPPSIAELQADLARRIRLAQNVTLIKAREEQERLGLPGPEPNVINDGIPCKSNLVPEGGSAQAPSTSTGATQGNQQTRIHSEDIYVRPNQKDNGSKGPWVPRPESDEPEMWSPRVIHRRG